MRGSSPSTIQIKLWKAIFFPVLGVIASALVYLSISQYLSQTRYFEQINAYLTEQAANASEYALLFNDKNLITNNIQSLLLQEDVVGVTYYNSKQEVVDSLGREIQASTSLTQQTHSYYLDKEALYISSSPVFYATQTNNQLRDTPLGNNFTDLSLSDAVGIDTETEQELLGWVQVYASTQRLKLNLITLFASVIGYFSLAAIASAFICWWFAGRIAAPWLNITEVLSRISNGEYDKTRPLKLPHFLKQTKEELVYISDRLENYRIELEDEINQITKETRENALLLEEKSAQLHIANKEAIESNRLKTQFLANISHEVRTPLNAILGYTQLLQKDQLGNQQKAYVDTIAQSTHNLLATIGDILDFSKIEAGKLILESNEFNLRDVVDEVFHILSSTLLNDDKDIDLIPIFSDDTPEWVQGDATRMRQILTNLVGNAIKFTQTGSVKVIVKATINEHQQLDVNIQVIDTGLGIPSESIGQLFKPFSQVDPSRSRNYSGTGLGLVITKKLIEQMDGSIGVSSELGRGSNFYFNVKLQPSDKITAPLSPLHKHLIILEPNANYRDHLKSLLDDLEATHEYTSSIEQFVNALHSHAQHYDAALIQTNSGQKAVENTYELVNYLQTRFQIPCILMTKPINYIAQHSQLHNAVSDILMKPINPRKLHSALSSASLQLDNDDQITTAPEETSSYSQLEGVHVLAVDDTAINLQLLSHWLEPHNIKLSLAFSGQQAIEMAMIEQYDLILMDIQMPQMDGMEATRRLRGLSNYQETPIIALTAHALAEEKQSILASGMNAYLTKPINEEILLNTLSEWCTTDKNISSQVADEVTEVFDVNKALSMAGNRIGAAKDLFNMLMESLTDDKRLLAHHFEAKELDKLIATVHRIHGASKYSGTTELTKHANYLETHLKELGFDEVEEVYDDFIQSIDRLENAQSLIPWPQESQTPEHNAVRPIN